MANFVAAILVGVVFVLALALVVVSSAPPPAILPVGLLFLFAAAFLIIGVKLLELRPWARVWAIRVYIFILVLDVASLPFKAPTIATLVWDSIALIGIGYLIQPSVRHQFDNSW